ncbi:MAG TPA: hypothetical protein VE974_04700 [Thermoanaerobaculia bacterium]|nr:hypothetical protein [Thermoanaerobaculia bacterium]
MLLKRRYYGFWTAIAFAVLCFVIAASIYDRGDDPSDLYDDTANALFAGFNTLAGALAYRSVKQRKLSGLPWHGRQMLIELAGLAAPLVWVATQEKPLALVQVKPFPLFIPLWTILAYTAAATGATQPRPPRLVRRTLITLGVVVALYATNAVYQSRQFTRTMSRSWPLLGSGLVSMPSRFPPQRKTDAASEAERIALSLGVSMVTAAGPQSRDRDQFEAVRPLLTGYINGAFVQPTRYVGPPPADLAQYLDLNRNALDDLRDFLLTNDPVAWELDLTNPRNFFALPMSLRGHLDIHRLFVTSALLSLARGESGRASEFLRAATAWSLSLRQRPELISRLIYFAEVRDILGGILKLPPPYPAWSAGIRREDMRALMSEGLAYENWMWVQAILIPPRFHTEDAAGKRTFRLDGYGVWRWILRPLLLQSQRHTIETERAILEQFVRLADCRTESTSILTEKFSSRYGLWLSYGVFFGQTSTNLATAWTRALGVALRSELASVVDRSSVQPAAGEKIRSTVCRDMDWLVSSRADGLSYVSLTLTSTGPQPDVRPAILTSFMAPPLEHVQSLAAPEAAAGAEQIVENGGFEEEGASPGEADSWSIEDADSENGPSRLGPIRQPAWTGAGTPAYAPRSGRWFALLNANGETNARLTQRFEIPENATTAVLTFSVRADGSRPGVTWLEDTLEVRLTGAMTSDSTTEAVLDVLRGRDAGVGSYSYQRRSYAFNVAPWRKQQLTLEFITRAVRPGSPHTVFLLDDVAVTTQ